MLHKLWLLRLTLFNVPLNRVNNCTFVKLKKYIAFTLRNTVMEAQLATVHLPINDEEEKMPQGFIDSYRLL